MNLDKIEEIERAIDSLTSQELGELRLRLDQYNDQQLIDHRIHADLGAGLLDKAILAALDDEKNGRLESL